MVRYVAGERQLWRRWWAPPDIEPPLDDGFLRDPAGPYGAWLAPGLLDLDELQETRALVLLGEPGSGKSDELARDRERWNAHSIQAVDIDLGSLPDWQAVQAAVFRNIVVQRWASNSGELVLLLDGFDEAQSTIPKLTDALLDGIGKLPADRLRLRITGRPSVWPTRLTEGLRGLWPSSFQVLVLAPLTADNVRSAARGPLGDDEAFLADVRQRDIGVLAARPITLGMLIDLAKQGPLPDNRSDLYSKAVEIFAVENHERRMEERADGPAAGRRVAAAETLATTSLVSGRPVIVRRRKNHAAGIVLAIDDIADHTCTMADLEAVLDSALLAPGSDDTLRWTHRTIPEFLAGRQLSGLHLKTVRHLLADAESGSHLVPQLTGVAVWAASMNSDVLDWLIETDPALLLTPDLRTASPDKRRQIAQALLMQLAQGNLPGEWRRYGHLDYPELASDVAPLLGPDHPPAVRGEAMYFLASNDRRELDGQLMTIIEEVSDRGRSGADDGEVAMAVTAGHTLQGCGDEAVLGRAAAVATDTDAPEPVRATMVSLLLRHRGLPTVLALLETDLLAGSRSYLAREVANELATALTSDASYAGTAIQWLAAHPPSARKRTAFVKLAGAAILAAASGGSLDDAGWATAGTLCAEQVVDGGPPFDWDPDVTAGISREHRRRLAREALLAGQHRWDAHSLRDSGLLLPDDLEHWLAEYATALGLDADVERVAEEALDTLAEPTSKNRAIAQAALGQHPQLRPWFSRTFSAERAQQWQSHHESQASRRAVEARRQADATFSSTRLTEFLDDDDWPAAAAELTHPADDRPGGRYVSGLPLSTGPAWTTLDEVLRHRVVVAAEAYLSSPPDPPVLAAADEVATAYALLVDVAPDKLQGLSAGNLLAWLPPLLEVPASHAAVGAMLEHVGAARPTDVEAIMVAGLQQDAQGQHAAVAARLGDTYTSPAVEDALAQAIDHDTTDPWVVDTMLGALMKRDPARATAVALDIVGRRPASAPHDDSPLDLTNSQARLWNRAVSAAKALTRSPLLSANFPNLLAHFEQSTDFAAAVIRHPGIDRSARSWAALSEEQLSELYRWARTSLPEPSRPSPGVVTTVNPVREFAGEILGMLRSRVNPATADALDRLSEALDERWLQNAATEVRKAARAQTWAPLRPVDVRDIIAEPARRVVTTEKQLAEVLLDALDDFQQELQSNPDVKRTFWERQWGKPLRYIPPSETDFTARLFERLRPRLSAVVLRQEVQLHASLGDKPGAFPDFEAIARPPGGGEIAVVGEVKCNWHPDVRKALKAQLVRRYLDTNRTHTGIYIVAWYAGDAWDPCDDRLNRARKDRERLLAGLEGDARDLPHGRVAYVRVLDLSLNGADTSI